MIAVAVGVALEGVELFHDSVTWVKRWHFKKKELAAFKELAKVFPVGEMAVNTGSFPSYHPRWVKRLERIGLIIVVAGVIGEWRYGAKLEDTHNALHGLDMALLRATQQEADSTHDLGTDLLEKYRAAEHEITELKAEKLPRRLSSEQKAVLRKQVAKFATKNLFVGCANGGQETFDFEQDFVEAFLNPDSKLKLEYALSCSVAVGPTTTFSPPIQVEYGADRKGDSEILVKALVEIGVNRKDIVIKTNDNNALLALEIGPKAP